MHPQPSFCSAGRRQLHLLPLRQARRRHCGRAARQRGVAHPLLCVPRGLHGVAGGGAVCVRVSGAPARPPEKKE
eukprot:365214-Chlamydomonas_euryale.AAC.4